MYSFVPIYKQKVYILKIELFLGIHTILWNKKSVLKCFKCYSEKSLNNFGNRLEIGTAIIKQKINLTYIDIRNGIFRDL